MTDKEYDDSKTEKSILAIVTLSHLAQHFTVGLSVLYPDIMNDLSLNYTQLGIITGSMTIISGFLQMVWSILNRYLSRRILLGLGNLLMSVGCFIIGRAGSFIELLGGNIVRGSGQAAQHPVGTSIITQKFPLKKISWALSIHYGLGYVGNIISPILLSSIALYINWRWATYLLTMVPLFTGIMVLYFLRKEESTSKSIQNLETSLFKDIKSVIHVKGVILVIAAQAFAVGGSGMGVIITYTPLFLNNILNVGIFETSVIYSLAVLGGVLGTIMFGRLSGKLGNLKTAYIVVGICSTLISLLTVYKSFNFLLVLHLFLVGTTSFASGSLLQAHLSSISTPGQRDVILGLYFTIGFGLSSIWTALTGYLIDVYSSFTPAWILRAVLGTIAFLLIVYASRQK